MAFLLENTQRVVIKVGTGILTSGVGQLDRQRIDSISSQIANLKSRGIEVTLVSSGAIGLGMGLLELTRRPTDMATLQVCAALGQTVLVETWQAAFKVHKILAAQLLFTRDDLKSRKRHVAAKDMMERMLHKGIVPIVNENDSISTEEIKFGDNDVLSALVASMIKAEHLIILTRAPGLIDRQGSGAVVPVITEFSDEILAMAEDTDDPTGRGGMVTKLEAAQLATRNGCGVFIGYGKNPEILNLLFSGEPEGTYFVPELVPMKSQKRWIAFFQHPVGCIQVDQGARDALIQRGGSLLAKGVIKSEGSFKDGDVVNITDPEGNTFARGITQFSSFQVNQVAGLSTPDIKSIFPRRTKLDVVNRDYLVVL